MIYENVEDPRDLVVRSEGKGFYLSAHHQVRVIKPRWHWSLTDTSDYLTSGRFQPVLPGEFLR